MERNERDGLCRSGEEGGEDCDAEQMTGSFFGLCLLHEKLERGRRWAEVMDALRRGRTVPRRIGANPLLPPLCDADGCLHLASVEGFDSIGWCAEHEPLPPSILLAAATLRDHARSAAKACDAEPKDAWVRGFANVVLAFVERLAREEGKRGPNVAGSILGEQPRNGPPAAGAGGAGSAKP